MNVFAPAVALFAGVTLLAGALPLAAGQALPALPAAAHALFDDAVALTKCSTDACLSSCIEKTGFADLILSDSECFPGEALPSWTIGSSAVTDRSLDTICACAGQLTKGIELAAKVMQCSDRTPRAFEGDLQPREFSDYVSASYEFLCLKQNGRVGDYCATTTLSADQEFDFQDADSWAGLSEEEQAKYLGRVGCCGQSLVELAEDGRIVAAEPHAVEPANLLAPAERLRAAYNRTGLEAVACLGGGQSDNYTTIELELSMVGSIPEELRDLADNSARGEFVSDLLQADVATLLNVSLPQVNIPAISVTIDTFDNITYVNVDVSVRGTEHGDALRSRASGDGAVLPTMNATFSDAETPPKLQGTPRSSKLANSVAFDPEVDSSGSPSARATLDAAAALALAFFAALLA